MKRPALTPKRQESLKTLLDYLGAKPLPKKARHGREYLIMLLEHEQHPSTRIKRQKANIRSRDYTRKMRASR